MHGITLPLLFSLKLPYQLRWEYVTHNKWWFIDGLGIGLKLAFFSLIVGSAIGLFCAFARQSGNPIAKVLVTAYVELIRNVPLLLLVLVFYFGLPQAFPRRSTEQKWILKLLPTPERTFMVAFAIYAGAYLTEIFGAGLLSVSKRYLDAGRSLGLRRFALARHVTTPIMFRAVLPSLSNTFISLFKDTGIAFYIGVTELSFAANKVSTEFFRPIEGWAAAGVLYLTVSYALAISLRFAERRIRWTL